jgi:ABC-type multidrug transport system fused ATPase/permease subunit
MKRKKMRITFRTANVDFDMDVLIQKTVRNEFGGGFMTGCTIISIAHRLNTVMSCDKILVMDNGKAVQFKSPKALLEDKGGIFYGMWNDSGMEEKGH